MQTLNVTSTDLLQSDMHPTFDSVVYVNVLEHIRDDVDELRTAHELLVPGGTLAIFVPALPRLYGSLDYKSGHHRRYTADTLRDVIDGAGFEVADVRYLDVLGVVPYFVMYRLLDVKTLGSVSSNGYDRVIVPVSRAVQRLVPHPPVGKNLLAIARRPHDASRPHASRLEPRSTSTRRSLRRRGGRCRTAAVAALEPVERSSGGSVAGWSGSGSDGGSMSLSTIASKIDARTVDRQLLAVRTGSTRRATSTPSSSITVSN